MHRGLDFFYPRNVIWNSEPPPLESCGQNYGKNKRIEIVRKIHEAGITVGVTSIPLFPYISDSEEDIENFIVYKLYTWLPPLFVIYPIFSIFYKFF